MATRKQGYYQEKLETHIGAWVREVQADGERFALMLGLTVGPDLLAEVKREIQWWDAHGFRMEGAWKPDARDRKWQRPAALYSLETLLEPFSHRDVGNTTTWAEMMEEYAEVLRACAPRAGPQAAPGLPL